MHIGNRLKRIRTVKQLGQVSVCKGIISISHYSNVEAGRYEASEDLLISLAQRLGVPESYLLYTDKNSKHIDNLIGKFRNTLEYDLPKVEEFKNKYRDKFEYILSIKQEIAFLLQDCAYHIKIDNLEKAQEIFNEVLIYIDEKRIESLPNETIFFYYYCSGLLQFFKRNFEESLKLFKTALKYEVIEDDLYKGKILYNISLIYFYTNDIRKAIATGERAINHFSNSNNWVSVIDVYGLLGILYTQLYEYKNAIKSYEKALALVKEHDHEKPLGKLLHNLGMVYYISNELPLALDYFDKSLNQKKATTKEDMLVSYIGIVFVKLKTNDLNGIEQLIDTAKPHCCNKYDENRIKLLEAQLAYNTNHYSEYEKEMEKCLNFFYSNQYWPDIENFAKQLAEYYFEQRKYKKAYYYLNMELEARDYLYKQRA
ncbi:MULTISPECIES: helix-turn-helix domain-containing protein [Bacillaceae]|uniref:Tetratricopeptide repeat protein n=1 Tax=Evansella alkalicola TaxID=745819 RepID=A0ABS6JNE9_9BACI|nr:MULTISPECIES: tetratricopeptide repeat protein [Bacillaceae]MBU9720092.1 tetratricopeptide repeat protein [Bacillus alkalicola]